MKSEARKSRQAEIEAAAYRVIEEKGAAGLSMLAVARAAKASNETLYNWYGDKQGLFAALIARNSDIVQEALTASQERADTAMMQLQAIGPVLLAMVLGERAIALNRAAAQDASGALGQALAQGGRGVVAPLVTGLVAQAMEEQGLQGAPEVLAQTYLTHLISDLQIRRVTNVMPVPDRAFCEQRSTQALVVMRCVGGAGPWPAQGVPMS